MTVDEIIKTLADGMDLDRALTEHKLKPETVLRGLDSPRGKAQLKARRRLARIHSRLVAHRFSPFAVQKLCQLLTDDKSELRLKGALSILTLAGLGEKKARAAKKKGTFEEERVATPEDEEVMAALAEVLARRRGEGGEAGGN